MTHTKQCISPPFILMRTLPVALKLSLCSSLILFLSLIQINHYPECYHSFALKKKKRSFTHRPTNPLTMYSLVLPFWKHKMVLCSLLWLDVFTQHHVSKIHPYYYVKMYYIHSCTTTISYSILLSCNKWLVLGLLLLQCHVNIFVHVCQYTCARVYLKHRPR